MDEPMYETTWPTTDEQQAARAEGCTCRCVKPGSHLEPPEWEQDPYCGEHGDRVVMRATIRKAHANPRALLSLPVPPKER